ncbi:protein FAR1-RELATED SEQUENCE 5-like [Ipomoea triloba]|uniref:protein FAR1-RELATED SEQUENCE 5-like n=1 Tax=Ipomoea triloba TaxID=35885 RepID=UPI00125D3D49|nr:protein FAR1-RELATED SEQUENCE 5-like [Ipomoea triloba]
MEANGAEMWENNSGSEENGEQEAECEMEISPNGAKQWIPTANPEETPYTGQKFKTVDEGIEFYKAYAKAVGFDVRHGTMRKTRGGEVGIKYMVCSREGFKPTVKEKNSQKGADAQMVVEDLFKKKEMNPDFYFDFDLDDGGELCRLFWADGTSRKNFACFGDVMSFDATYRTNKYRLVFVPFTGVDHHKRCITFEAGLLAKEDTESYKWLLTSFKNAMGATPRCAITDQDAALKVAVPNIMPTTRHRFCMWHIMTKVGDKAGSVLAQDKEFRKTLNSVIWDETLSVEEFENRWLKVMEDYNLAEDRCLVEFFMQYNSAIEEQIYKQNKLNAECECSFQETKTALHMEQQAATLYTVNMFYEFQTEIWEASFTCHVIHQKDSIDVRTYTVQEKGGKAFEVTMHTNGEKIECTCKKFIRVGILCRHALLVFNSEGVEEIPGEYIVPRWTRDAAQDQCITSGGQKESTPKQIMRHNPWPINSGMNSTTAWV